MSAERLSEEELSELERGAGELPWEADNWDGWHVYAVALWGRERVCTAIRPRDAAAATARFIAAARNALPSLLSEVRESRSKLRAADTLVEALEKCDKLFNTIRNDWTDPRTECKEGRALIKPVLAAWRAAGGGT